MPRSFLALLVAATFLSWIPAGAASMGTFHDYTAQPYYVVERTGPTSFCAGTSSSGSDGGTIWCTQDGMTWTNAKVDGRDATTNVAQIDFVDATNGWVVGGFEGFGVNGLMARTSDGGRTWTNAIRAVMDSVGSTTYVPLYYLSAIDASTAFAANGYYLYRTSDAGRTFVGTPFPFVTGPTDIVRTMKFVDARNGYAWTDSRVLRTYDGGDHWAATTLPWAADAATKTVTLNDHMVLGTEQLAASVEIGGTSYLFRSRDAGGTWSRTAMSGLYPGLYMLSFTDLLRGSTSAVERSSDGGATWSQVFATPSSFYGSWPVHFRTDATGAPFAFAWEPQGYYHGWFEMDPSALTTTASTCPPSTGGDFSNTREGARLETLPYSYYGTVGGSDPADHACVRPHAGYTLQVWVNVTSGEVDLALLDANGALLGSSAQAGTAPERIDYVVPSAGDHFVRLTSPSTGAYTLEIRETPPTTTTPTPTPTPTTTGSTRTSQESRTPLYVGGTDLWWEAENETASDLTLPREPWDSRQETPPPADRAGYSGQGNWYLSRGGDRLTYTFEAPAAGTFTLWARDWNDSTEIHAADARDVTYSFNGVALGERPQNPFRSGWDWLKVGEVQVKAGTNTFTVQKSETTSAAAMFDVFMLAKNSLAMPRGPMPSTAKLSGPGSSGGANAIWVRAATRTVGPGGSVLVPVTIENASGIGNMDVVLSFDPNTITVVSVTRGALTTSTSFESTVENGVVRIGIVSSQGLSGSGTIANLNVRALGAAGTSSPIEFEDVAANAASTLEALHGSAEPGAVRIVAEAQILLGDVNGDGRVNSVDALMALKMSVHAIPTVVAADVNKDGRVTSLDASMILRAAVGKLTLGGP